ncbi:hypothetical protein SCHPADRAFT_944126 [Schizopora paradoxa]|uniref:Uncharacterized protein n=1 Tax=Schizopora paradoxa TaxID=27342 RepID=A0A0H2RH19_9AGAM|nr:hypothetical protein SCHPADRAFT_944126 [Schizopora paradoxa]
MPRPNTRTASASESQHTRNTRSQTRLRTAAAALTAHTDNTENANVEEEHENVGAEVDVETQALSQTIMGQHQDGDGDAGMGGNQIATTGNHGVRDQNSVSEDRFTPDPSTSADGMSLPILDGEVVSEVDGGLNRPIEHVNLLAASPQTYTNVDSDSEYQMRMSGNGLGGQWGVGLGTHPDQHGSSMNSGAFLVTTLNNRKEYSTGSVMISSVPNLVPYTNAYHHPVDYQSQFTTSLEWAIACAWQGPICFYICFDVRLHC